MPPLRPGKYDSGKRPVSLNLLPDTGETGERRTRFYLAPMPGTGSPGTRLSPLGSEGEVVFRFCFVSRF